MGAAVVIGVAYIGFAQTRDTNLLNAVTERCDATDSGIVKIEARMDRRLTEVERESEQTAISVVRMSERFVTVLGFVREDIAAMKADIRDLRDIKAHDSGGGAIR
jgi:hypothetical protein